MLYIISLINNILQFEKFFLCNAYLSSPNIKVIPVRKHHDSSPGKLYNTFLDNLPSDAKWLFFTTDSLELHQDPSALLQNMTDDSLYGIFGAKTVWNNDGELFQTYSGQITESCPQKQPMSLSGPSPVNCTPLAVDSVDSRSLLVSASFIRKHAARFDPNLELLYGEDFCFRAFDLYATQSYTIPLQATLHESFFYTEEQLAKDITLSAKNNQHFAPRAGLHAVFGREQTSAKKIITQKAGGRKKSKIYSVPVALDNYNLPSVLVAKMLQPGSRLLDAGCAVGDNGVFFKQHLACDVYGMDYDSTSLAFAASKNIYTELHQIDLNNFAVEDYSRYYHFFDTILLLDVLEHLYAPQEVLQALTFFLKPNGSFIISLPNLAHMHPLLSLFTKQFTYQEYGILDATHIRFFTWKSIAANFATWGFQIHDCSATFRSPHLPFSNAPTLVPHNIIEELLQDPHSLVCQYVCKISPSQENYADLKAHNLALLEKSTLANNVGWKAAANDIATFKHKAARTAGADISPEERSKIMQLVKKDSLIEAIKVSGLFDEVWYKEQYDEVDFSTTHPLLHYLQQGWKEGKNPSEAFDGEWYQRTFASLIPENFCPLVFHVTFGVEHRLPHSKVCGTASVSDLAKYAQHVLKQEERHKKSFVPMRENPYQQAEGDPRLIAFYLPQFSPFPENDQWWGKGFTEWTNVTKAVPLYAGHYQPHLPYDLGFYDLRVKETCLRQEELARHYGIHGFCYHYYWFDGKKIMNAPIERKLLDKNLSLPFCLSWANEPWSASWDGSEDNVLIKQSHNIQTELLFQELLPFFKDERYIRIDGKPFFMVYRPTYFSTQTVFEFMTELQRLAKTNGLPGLHLTVGTTERPKNQLLPLEVLGADAYVEFPPHRFNYLTRTQKRICNPKTHATVSNLPKLIENYKNKDLERTPTYRTVLPMWDNSPRRANKGAVVLEGGTPQLYCEWLTWCIQKTSEQATSPDANLVFINAWNEWAEGAHLEPDRKYGYAFLEATTGALYAARKIKK